MMGGMMKGTNPRICSRIASVSCAGRWRVVAGFSDLREVTY